MGEERPGSQTMTGRRRNIEVKARCSDLAVIHARAMDLGARESGTLRQRDTFFAASRARLKLREFGDGRAELISYTRPDIAMARGSDYVIAPVDRPADVRSALEHALGIVCVVTKVRRVLLFRSSRIHLDEVDGLGSFVEIETIVDGQPDADAHAEIRVITAALGIEERTFVALSYGDGKPGKE